MKQVLVVTGNRPGIVADISAALSEAGINIDSISANTLGKIGLVSIMARQESRVLKILNDKGYSAVTEEVLLVRQKDEPGALAKVAGRLKQAGINITSLMLIERDGEFAITAIACDRMEAAKKALADLLVS
jgi:hypothetical protein